MANELFLETHICVFWIPLLAEATHFRVVCIQTWGGVNMLQPMLSLCFKMFSRKLFTFFRSVNRFLILNSDGKKPAVLFTPCCWRTVDETFTRVPCDGFTKLCARSPKITLKGHKPDLKGHET